jgi:hypothetical protein
MFGLRHWLMHGGYLAVEDRTITILRKLPTGW